MTQVLQHDYGKSKVTRLQIRAAIKAVKAERSELALVGLKEKAPIVQKTKRPTATKSR